MPISPVIWRNQFENTVSPYGWDGTGTTGGATAVNSNRPHHGNYGLYATINAGALLGQHASVLKACGTVAYHDHLFARAMNVMLDVLPYVTPPAGTMIDFYQVLGPATAIAMFGLGNNAGALKWFSYYRNLAAFSTAWGPTAVLNTPYCVEAEVLQSSTGNADGAIRLWVDGCLVIEQTGLDNDERDINYVGLGLISTDQGVAAQHMWGDCFVLSAARIRCENALRSLRGRGGDSVQRSNQFSSYRSGTRMGLH